MQTLAWLVKPAFPQTRVSFKWQEEYNFAWSEIETLGSGIRSEASQIWTPADPTSALRNSVRLTYARGAYRFVPARTTAPEGILFLEQDESIPMRQAQIGIGMLGRTFLALPAQPNINLIFKPSPVYLLRFGWQNPGDALPLWEVSNPLTLSFPANVDTLTATLTEANRWQVQPGAGTRDPGEIRTLGGS